MLDHCQLSQVADDRKETCSDCLDCSSPGGDNIETQAEWKLSLSVKLPGKTRTLTTEP